MSSSINTSLLTDKQIEELKRDYPCVSNKELAERYGVNIKSLGVIASKLGLRKSCEYMKRCGSVKTQFKPGCIPANKGKKMPEHVYIACSKSMFKKGNKPHNILPIGSERVTKDGYIEVKVRKRGKRWELKHRVVWRKKNGEIPKGYNVQFKDGNRQNCDINNLYLISRREQMKSQNSMYCRYPKDLQLAMSANRILKRRINKQLNNKKS